MKKICQRCGKTFSHNYNVLCRSCIDETLRELVLIKAEPEDVTEEEDEDTGEDLEFMYSYYCEPSNRPKVRERSQLYDDVKAAAKLKLSYGEYMARKREGRI